MNRFHFREFHVVKNITDTLKRIFCMPCYICGSVQAKIYALLSCCSVFQSLTRMARDPSIEITKMKRKYPSGGQL